MPKWKNGDVAACPESVRSPTRLVVHTYPAAATHPHRATKERREAPAEHCWNCGGDPDPAKDAARLERKLTSALASYHCRKERGVPLTDEERAAQRAPVGFLNGATFEVFECGTTWW